MAYTKAQNEYYKARRRKNPEAHRIYNRRSYQKNKIARDQRTKDYQRQAKIDVVAHYSSGTNRCACCGVEGIPFLTIDHINGDGALLRKQGKHKTGSMFYIWLRQNKYPAGLQVLCHNCNQAKRQMPCCPHQSELINTPKED